jgi:hypothetical protein
MRIAFVLSVLLGGAGQQITVPAAASKFVRGTQWHPMSVVEGDFTCAGRKQYAILGTTADHIVVAVFIAGTAQSP